jgi:predicted RecB family endonuclease
MGLAEKLERLVRIIPGVAGYQDNESARDTDKAVRMKLAEQLDGIKLDIDKEKLGLVEGKDLSLLPALDRAASKISKTANTIKYAARGFSGIFDKPRVDLEQLEKLSSFDIALLEDMEDLKTLAKNMSASSDASLLKDAVAKLDNAIDSLDRKFSSRQEIISDLER